LGGHVVAERGGEPGVTKGRVSHRIRISRGLKGWKGCIALAFLVMAFFWACAAEAREIVDMRGKRVLIPDVIKRVYSSSPPVTFLIAAIDPELLVGLNVPINQGGKPYLPPALHGLPVLGGFFGRGQTANIEMVLKAKPDIIITGGFRNTALNDKYEESLKVLGIPILFVSFETLPEYGNALRFLGKVLNREDRTKKLSAYGNDVLLRINKNVSAIPASKRPTVYYAEDMDGLATECTGSPHAELLDIAGARNVHSCKPKDAMGMETVNLERVVLYNPDVIIVKERVFFDKIFSDSGWKQTRAVRTKRVYLIPNLPFNWFDRPPSFMRFLGIQWLMGCLYPNEYKGKDIVQESRAFYRLFLGMDLKESDIRKVIGP
jgi:iron complex transport system substrate-binding protein